MTKRKEPRFARKQRHIRLRKNLKGVEGRPRLCVFRSLNHIYAQIVDDIQGHTLVSASSIDSPIKEESGEKSKTSIAQEVGKAVANKAKDKGITQVVFDRGGFKYHGRVKALADGARESGLVF